MDPNEALKNARAALARIRAADHLLWHAEETELLEAGDALADSFEALDGWLTAGGFLPTAWGSANRHRDDVDPLELDEQ